MNEWLNCFFNDPECTLELDGVTYSKNYCELLGVGSEKRVFKFRNTTRCFFIPHKIRDEQQWNITIHNEKFLLDQILELGLMAQKFERTTLNLKGADGINRGLQVLTTQDLASLAEEQSLVIHNPKGDSDNAKKTCSRLIGALPGFYKKREQFKDPQFVKGMLGEIIKEFAVASTFSLPIRAKQTWMDDSEHFCFKVSTETNNPLLVHYIFWDVCGDFSGRTLPLVPTLDELKYYRNGKKESISSTPIRTLASGIACSILEIINTEKARKIAGDDDSDNKYDRKFHFEFHSEVEKSILSCLEEDEYLSPALDHAKELAVRFLNNDLVRLEKDNKITPKLIPNLMRSAISTGNLDSVKKVLSHYPNVSDIPTKTIRELIDFAKKYQKKEIIDHLYALCTSSLNETFKQKYKQRLAADNSRFCGLYSFFSRSYVTEQMTLKDLVQHGQGLSKQGTGARTRSVLKEMGLLDERNELVAEYKWLNSNSI